MMKKVFLGLLAVAIAGSIAHSGYTFGRYLANKGKAGEAQTAGQTAGWT